MNEQNEMNLKLTNKNNNYTVKIKKINNYFDCYLWTKNGMISLLHKKFKTLDDFDKIKNKTINDFENNIIHCCNCDKRCNYLNVINNQFFAGVYCDDCWEKFSKEMSNDYYD